MVTLHNINEAHITVKRKYTDEYPSKMVYDGAKVRNTIFKAIGDGILTEDEIKKILEEIGADNKWHHRHKYFFNVSENGSSKSYKLSEKAKKLMNKYKKKLDISEDDTNENLINLLTYNEFINEMKVYKIAEKKSQGWIKASLLSDISKLKSGDEILVDKNAYDSAKDDDSVEIFHNDTDYIEIPKKLIKF